MLLSEIKPSEWELVPLYRNSVCIGYILRKIKPGKKIEIK